MICLLLYFFAIRDSVLNIYKKCQIDNDATAYINKNYPDFKLSEVDVRYDRELNFYVAECKSDSDTIVLQYAPNLSMELDCYYDSIYAEEALKYQEDMEKKLASALKDAGIECDAISVYVSLNAADKDNLVFKGEEIKNERIDCYIEYEQAKNESTMKDTEFAQLSKDVASCIYDAISDKTSIETLEIKYISLSNRHSAISWDNRMEKMSVDELADEIK